MDSRSSFSEVLERRKLVKCYKKEFSKINKKFRCNFFPFFVVFLYIFSFFFVVVYFLFLFFLLYFIFSFFLLFFVSPFPFSFSMLSKIKINQTKNKPIKSKQNQYKKLFHTFYPKKFPQKSSVFAVQFDLTIFFPPTVPLTTCERRFFFFSFFLCEIIIIF